MGQVAHRVWAISVFGGFQDLTGWNPEQAGHISQLLKLWAGVLKKASSAPFQPELSWNLFAYSSAKPLYFTCSILKLPDLSDTPPPALLKHSANLFDILFVYLILLYQGILFPYEYHLTNFCSSSNPFSVLTPLWKVLEFWILPRGSAGSRSLQILSICSSPVLLKYW